MDNKNQGNYYWIWWVAVVLAIIIASIYIWTTRGGGSADTTAPAAQTDTGSTLIHSFGLVTIGLGQQARFQGITIHPLSIAEDSRCAAGVQCIQAGTVRIVVESVFDSGTSEQDTMALGTTTTVGGFAVALTSVDPQALAGTRIANQDYRFTFDVHESASGAGLQGKG